MQPHEDQHFSSRLYHQILDQPEPHSPPPKHPATPALQLEVELQDGRKVYLNPHPHDPPLKIASQFCQQHNLDSSMVILLTQSITKSIAYSQESHQKQSLLKQDTVTHPSSILIADPTVSREKGRRSLSKKGVNSNSQLNLYQKGRLFQERHKLWVSKQKEYQKHLQKKQQTFVPTINQHSRRIASQRSLSRLSSADHNKSRDKSQKEKAQKVVLALSPSVNISTFQDKNSLLRQRRRSELKERDLNKGSHDVFQELYQNRKNERQKVSKINEEATFHPFINSISRDIVGSANFEERMQKYEEHHSMRQQKRKVSERQENKNMHRPKTGQAPANRNVQKLPIGQYLYKNRRKKTVVVTKPHPAPIITPTSRQLYEKKKELVFQKIFQELACQESDQISWKSIEHTTLNPTVESILMPLIEQIQIMEIQLGKQDFKTALNYLFGTLTPHEKNSLLSSFTQKHNHIEEPHKVLMNKKSKDLVRHISRGQMDVLEYGELREALREEEVEAMRIAKERKEMKDCTFRPKIERNMVYF